MLFSPKLIGCQRNSEEGERVFLVSSSWSIAIDPPFVNACGVQWCTVLLVLRSEKVSHHHCCSYDESLEPMTQKGKPSAPHHTLCYKHRKPLFPEWGFLVWCVQMIVPKDEGPGVDLMKIAALYDIHGNLPALNAVLEELKEIQPDLIVVGGDILSGPMPAQTLERLFQLGNQVRFIRGNADREVVLAFDGLPFQRRWLPRRVH